MEPPLRSLSACTEAAMSGNPSGPADAEGPAKAVQILETLRAMRQLVTFCPDDLFEAFANHFSAGQIEEIGPARRR